LGELSLSCLAKTAARAGAQLHVGTFLGSGAQYNIWLCRNSHFEVILQNLKCMLQFCHDSKFAPNLLISKLHAVLN